jgi:hypothetical protein
MRTIYAHLHIPKCGGSTVSNFLSRNFPGPALGNTNGILNDYQYDAIQVARIIDHFPALKCLTGHKLSLELPFDRDDLEIHAFTFVRDPVDRFVSHYFYHRNHTTLVPQAKEMDLTDYIDWALAEGNQNMYINGQVKFLSQGNLDVIRCSIAENRLHVFPLSRLEDALFTLASLFPNDFSHLGIQTQNVSKKDQELPGNLRDRVLPYVSDDLELLKLATQTPLKTRTNTSVALSPNANRSLTTSSVHKLGRFLVRCGNYLSRFG